MTGVHLPRLRPPGPKEPKPGFTTRSIQFQMMLAKSYGISTHTHTHTNHAPLLERELFLPEAMIYILLGAHRKASAYCSVFRVDALFKCNLHMIKLRLFYLCNGFYYAPLSPGAGPVKT